MKFNIEAALRLAAPNALREARSPMCTMNKFRWIPFRLVSLAYAINVAYVLWFILFHLNFLQIDIAGHMAGAMSLLRVGLHGYQDQFFQGYVQNLFYPPLEDLLLALMFVVSGYKHLVAFKIYLLAITSFFCFSLWSLSRVFRSEGARVFVLLVIIFLANIQKVSLTTYQGLSFCDVLITGLSSQVLAGGFFFFLVREVVSARRVNVVGFLLAATILSHLVIGLVAAILVGAFLLQERRLYAWARVGVWALTTSFFFLPFLLTREYLVSSNLTVFDPGRLLLFAVVGLLLFFRDKGVRCLLSVASFLLFVQVFSGSPNASPRSSFEPGELVRGLLHLKLPAFHYYRLGMPALYLVVAAMGLQIDRWGTIKGARSRLLALVYCAAGLWVIWGEVGGRIQRYSPSRPPALESLSVKAPFDPPWGGGEGIPRTWFVETSRAIDFGLETYLSLSQPDLFFSKGLLWESSRNTTLSASYLATLFGPPTILDYFYFYGFDCEARACLMDMMARDQGLQWMVYSPDSPPRYVNREHAACMQSILTDGTREMSFEPRGTVTVEGVRYQAFNLLPRSAEAALGRRFVEVIEPASLRFYSDQGGREYVVPLLNDYFGSCVRHKTLPSTVFVREEWKPTLTELLGDRVGSAEEVDAVARGMRLSAGHYKIILNSGNKPALLRIKLNYFPGFHLRDSRGQEVPIFEGLSGMVAYGSGELSLDYERPFEFYLAYALSILAVCVLGVSLIRGPRSPLQQTSLRES